VKSLLVSAPVLLALDLIGTVCFSAGAWGASNGELRFLSGGGLFVLGFLSLEE
jgi:hypothetical protein